MSTPTLFIDRDGTLIEEPPDKQVDSLRKLRFMPGLFEALRRLTSVNYHLVMVTNQDGLGSWLYPRTVFEEVQAFLLDTLSSQGIFFDAILICPHTARDECGCRKPKTGLLEDYLKVNAIDHERSAVIGDRDTDLELAANLGVRGFRVQRAGAPSETWSHVLEALLARRAALTCETNETAISVRVNLDEAEPISVVTGIAFFDHMLTALAKHAGISLELECKGDLNVDEHHTVEDCALALGKALRQALGTKRGIARYGFVLPMDESQATVALDLSGRPFSKFEGRFNREMVGQLATELVPHFFRSFADGLAAAIHVSVKGENAHHMIEASFKGVGRSLRQGFRREGGEIPSTKGLL